MSAAYAARTVSERSRSRRDTLLLAGGATLAGAWIFVLIEAILSLVDELQSSDPAALKASSGTDLLAACLGLAAFSILVPTFLARSRSRRATLLGAALSLVAATAAAMLTSDLLRAVEYAVLHAPGTYVAQAFLAAVADVGVVIATVIGAIAFFSASSPLSGVRRDGRLGWAASVFAASRVFSMVSGILLLVFYSDNFLPSGITSGIGVAVAGDAVEIAAAVLVAVAFFLSQQRRNRAQGWLAPRDGLLAVAAAVLALSFLLTGIGKMVYAGGLSSAGFSSGKSVAGAWLDGVSSLVELAAAACVSVGFFLSRRAQTTRGSLAADGPVVPRPAQSGEEGAEVVSFCSNCGTPRSSGMRFCSSCGQAF
ncbi:MAG TPA: zinc-ribbon domain-containing protein [Gaiellaceae bacterium]|nr:zinc-ribbon domain-containing protein [Gaiellaceae bacterium]